MIEQLICIFIESFKLYFLTIIIIYYSNRVDENVKAPKVKQYHV